MLIATEFVLIYVPLRLVFVSAKIENYLEKSKTAARFRLFVLSQYLYVADSASVDCRFAVDPNRYAADSRGCDVGCAALEFVGVHTTYSVAFERRALCISAKRYVAYAITFRIQSVGSNATDIHFADTVYFDVRLLRTDCFDAQIAYAVILDLDICSAQSRRAEVAHEVCLDLYKRFRTDGDLHLLILLQANAISVFYTYREFSVFHFRLYHTDHILRSGDYYLGSRRVGVGNVADKFGNLHICEFREV